LNPGVHIVIPEGLISAFKEGRRIWRLSEEYRAVINLAILHGGDKGILILAP